MEKKDFLRIVAILIILICLIVAISGNIKKENVDTTQNDIVSNYREIVDNTTGETYYQVYNENTGEIIANVIEEYQVDIYLDNPDYVEVTDNEEIFEEDIIQ